MFGLKTTSQGEDVSVGGGVNTGIVSRTLWLACLGWETTRPQPTELPLRLPTVQQYAVFHAQ